MAARSEPKLKKAIRDADAMSRVTTEIAESENTMRQALAEVADAGNSIKQITKTIEDFARHTRIIAVNASIEATRAGANGAAFGIVAEEVESLAQKSNQAAQKVRDQVEISLQKSNHALQSSTRIGGLLENMRSLQNSMERSLSIAQTEAIDLQEESSPAAFAEDNNQLAYDPSTMSTGVDSIDTQHKALIDAMNGLDVAVQEGRGKDEITPMLDFMANYVVEHFQHEEAVMDRKKCPKAAINKAAHAKLLQKYTEWRRDFDKEGASLAMVGELHAFLRKWLVSHICGVDACMKHAS